MTFVLDNQVSVKDVKRMATPTKANAASNAKKKNNLGFKAVKSELKKVSWPNKKDLGNYTTVVLAFCAVTALGIFIADTIFVKGLSLL